MVIVKDGEIIGTGYNAPPNDQTVTRCRKNDVPEGFQSDKHCSLHAEQRAAIDALRNNPKKLAGSVLYFIRLDNEGIPLPSENPRCTICSKIVLDIGIAEFVMWRTKGICSYNTEEFNTASFGYKN